MGCLVEDLWSSVLRAVQKVVQASRVPRSDVEDVVGEAVCRVAQHWRGAPTAVQNWIGYACAVAHRECANYLRARRGDLKRSTDDVEHMAAADDPDVVAPHVALIADVKRAVRASLRTAHQVAVFQLHFEQRFSPHDVARALGCEVRNINRDIRIILAQARNLYAT
jgi:RNA polymerase sigma factor (sigma-70 family)